MKEYFLTQLTFVVILPVLMAFNVCSLFAGDKCQLPDGSEGICTLDKNCLEPINIFKKGGPSPTICGFESLSAIICCPNKLETKLGNNDSLLYRIGVTSLKVGDKCEFPDGSSGVCNYTQGSWISYLRSINSTPTVCADETLNALYCYPEIRDNSTVSDSKYERISVKKCREYFPINFGIDYPATPYAFGGFRVAPGLYPHVGALGWIFPNETGYAWKCGASLISENYALTAAHCAAVPDTGEFTKLEPVVIRFGVVNLTNNFEEGDVRIKSIVIHPLYSPPLRYHDLALLELDGPITFSNFIKPICLYQTFATEGSVTALGWGITTNYGVQSPDLLRVVLDIVDSENCSVQYTSNKRRLPDGIIEGQICSGHKNGEQDTCRGDSGGPLLKNDPGLFGLQSLAGITSFGVGCGKIIIPGVYTRITPYLDWIESIVWSKDWKNKYT